LEGREIDSENNTENWIIELCDEFSANTFKAPHKATLEYQINKL